MYQYLIGFACGIYIGTRYDMKPYVDSTEKSMKEFLNNIKKREEESDSKREESDTRPISYWWNKK